jgi:Ni/Fe-hydrogenase 1 B-type cytochrome subunit
MNDASARRLPESAPGRVYVWELPVRVTHWAIFLSVVVLCVTGTYIGRPFSAGGATTDRFVMGIMKVVHFYAAIVFDVALAARIGWMFFGNRYACWDQFIPLTRERWRGFVKTTKFYCFLRHSFPETIGLNPMLGLLFVGIFALELLMAATGFALYSVLAPIGSPMRVFRFLVPILGGLQDARWTHHVGMWLLITLVLAHIIAVVVISVAQRSDMIGSIFSGYKLIVDRQDGERDNG